MNLNEFIKNNNITIDRDKVNSFSEAVNKDGQQVMEAIYNALQKFGCSKQLTVKVLQNPYTWYELVDNAEEQIKDFVKPDGKLDESGLYYWLISD